MTDLLNSVKADLTDRRLLPVLAIVGVAVLAALAYVVLGGGSTSATSTPGASSSAPISAGSGLAVTPSQPDSTQPVAETTSGASAQHRGPARNPFAPLPGASKTTIASISTPATSTASSAAAAGSSSTSAGSGSSPPASSQSTPAAPSKPSAPAKPTTVYHVAVLFGLLPAGTPAASAQLTAHENLKLLTPLPSAKQALVVFRGVTAASKSATFTLVGEVILHGPGICVPSASQCQEVDLKAGQSEQLEYLNGSSEVVTYELRIVSISSDSASSASLHSVLNDESSTGRELLRSAGLLQLAGLQYSQAGVLVSTRHSARDARAHSASERPRPKR